MKNWKVLIPILTLISLIMAGGGVLVRYNTNDLVMKQKITDEKLIRIQADIDKKADTAEMKIILNSIVETMKELKEDSKEMKQDIKELIKKVK